MANGDTPWTWQDHDRWVREVYAPHVQEGQLNHHELERKDERLEALIIRIGIGIGSTLLLLLGGVATNLIVLVTRHG